MNRFLIALALICFYTSAQSQNAFESGYVIMNDGERIDCLIRNPDWSRSPNTIRYRLSEQSEVQSASVDDVMEFGVENFKFVRATVNVDESSDDMRYLSTHREPDFVEHTAFLKVLVEGKASLYGYDDDLRRRYFYSSNGKEFEPLIYKKYYTDATHIMENKKFHQQLYVDVNCNWSPEEIKQEFYNDRALAKYFVRYNECMGSESKVYRRKSEKGAFRLIPKAGVGVVSADLLFLNRRSSSFRTEIDKQLYFTGGIDMEFLLPIERDRFSILISPGYQQYSYEEYTATDSLVFNSRYATLGVGMRYSIYQNNVARWFGSFQYVQFISLNAEYSLYNDDYLSNREMGQFEMSGGPGMNFTFGRTFSNRIMIQAKAEFRFETGDDYIISNPVYSSYFLELGYSIF